MARRWTPDDDRALFELYATGMSRNAIAARLGRSVDAVDARRRALEQPARRSAARSWTAGEEAFLLGAVAAGIPRAEIARRLGRTPSAVCRRCEVLGATTPRAPRYSPAEDEAIAAAVRSGASLAALAPRIGRSEGALRLRAKSLGLVETGTRRRWSTDEDRVLRSGYTGGLSVEEIRRRSLPARSAGSIVARARLLGLAEHGRRWVPAEDECLRSLAALRVPAAYAARRLGRTEEAVRKRCRVLGLARLRAEPVRRSEWTAVEDDLLRARAGDSTAAVARALGRSVAAVRRRRRLLAIAPQARTQHHPLSPGRRSHAQLRAVANELPLSPARALVVARRLELELGEVRRLARATATRRLPSRGVG